MKKKNLISKEPEKLHLLSTVKESDRGCTILTAITLEDMLGQLTKGCGPLRDFAGKIKLAFDCGIIDRDEYDSLELVRELRNEAAHAMIEFRFTDKGVKEHVDKLWAFYYDGTWRQVMDSTTLLTDVSETKRRFIISATALFVNLQDKNNMAEKP